MTGRLELIVADLCSAIEDLQAHTAALQARARALRVTVDVGHETRDALRTVDLAARDMDAERNQLDLVGLEEVLHDLKDCVERERQELEKLAERQRLMAVAAPARKRRTESVRVRR